MERRLVYEEELDKLRKILEDVEPQKLVLAECIISDLAFLKAECNMLRDVLLKNGTVQFHPLDATKQKATEAGKQYLKNLVGITTLVKSLNSLTGVDLDEDSELDDYQ